MIENKDGNIDLRPRPIEFQQHFIGGVLRTDVAGDWPDITEITTTFFEDPKSWSKTMVLESSDRIRITVGNGDALYMVLPKREASTVRTLRKISSSRTPD